MVDGGCARDSVAVVYREEVRLVVCLCCAPVVMAGAARLAAGLTCLLLVLVVNVAETAVINVVYPQSSNKNYSVVELTCTGYFGEHLGGDPAVFKWNNVDIPNESFCDLEHNQAMNQISFTFNQQQEGTFSCEHNGNKAFVELAGT